MGSPWTQKWPANFWGIETLSDHQLFSVSIPQIPQIQYPKNFWRTMETTIQNRQGNPVLAQVVLWIHPIFVVEPISADTGSAAGNTEVISMLLVQQKETLWLCVLPICQLEEGQLQCEIHELMCCYYKYII